MNNIVENGKILKELEWEVTTNKIIKAIDDLKLATNREEVIKIAVEYMVIKMCENEEIFNDNLEMLDKYASNGIVKGKIYGRINN